MANQENEDEETPIKVDQVDFDLSERTFGPVKVGGKKYLVVEADTATAVEYRNRAMKAARFSDGKVSGVEGLAGVEPYLVSRCLFELVPASNVDPVDWERLPVSLADILKWPSRVTKPLFKKCQELSDLKEADDDKAKNS